MDTGGRRALSNGLLQPRRHNIVAKAHQDRAQLGRASRAEQIALTVLRLRSSFRATENRHEKMTTTSVGAMPSFSRVDWEVDAP